MRVQHSSAQHQTPLPPSLRHSRSSRGAPERPTELTSPRCHHYPKPVWILKSSVEMFPPSRLRCWLFFFSVSMVPVLFTDGWLYWSVFLKVLCVVFTHECCIFTSKFQLGPGLRGSLTSVHHAGFVAGLGGVRKKSCCCLKRKASVWWWWKSEPHTHVAHIWSEVGYMYTGSSTHNTFNITDLWGLSFSGVLNSSVF